MQDMTDLKLSNLDMSAIKQIFGTVMPHLPVRVGRICVFHPPWIVGKVLLPFVMTFMSRKLKSRIVIVKGEEPENLLEHIPATALPTELGGQLQFDAHAWSDALAVQL
ncbi:MAG: hypothetical protein HC767_09805 [Akkermansiaceae bacterium]|nr:hypothetical protein [Akkermansiaceae bacterium]